MRRDVAEVLRAWQRLRRIRRLRQAIQREFYRRGWPKAPLRYARPEGPHEGQTKPGKHGPLVFHDGRWHKVEGSAGGEPTQRSAEQPQGQASARGVGKIPRQSSRGVSAERFMQVRSRASYRAAFLSDYSLDELRKMADEGARFRLSEDGTAGYILHQGELKNLFCLRRHTGMGKAMLADAIARGAERLDCIGPELAAIYSQFGFVATRAEPWNDAYEPDGWDYDVWDRPDIIYMEYRGQTRDPDEIRRRAETDYYPPFQHPGYGRSEHFQRRGIIMTSDKRYEFRPEELPEELRSPEMMDRVQQQWEQRIDERTALNGKALGDEERAKWRSGFLLRLYQIGL